MLHYPLKTTGNNYIVSNAFKIYVNLKNVNKIQNLIKVQIFITQLKC